MRPKGKFFLAFVLLVFFAPSAMAATVQRGAVSTSNARTQAANAAAANLGAGPSGSGPGVDLKAIASPKKPQTLTGFPAGTLPGDSRGASGSGGGGSNNNPEGKVVFSGDPLTPIIGPEMMGSRLDYICTVAGHVGYTLERGVYLPTALDVAYMFRLMNGRRRVSTLYFDRSLKLLDVQ
ncbi:MAG: hypothetical protein LBQ42_02090 [Synergistaceae bacterium]|jgi:hypothetical protein|nr:hypothetical protein [Synergistaceae bacterium]